MGKLKGVEKLAVVVEIGLFLFRFIFYFVAMTDIIAERVEVNHYPLVLSWLVTVMVVPIFFWIPLVTRKTTYYCFLELFLNGSLTIYVMFNIDSYTALFVVSAITVAFHLEKRFYWLLPLMVMFPFVQFFIKGISVEDENPAFYIFDYWFLLMIGLGFNLIIKSYRNTENLNKIIEEKNQTLVQYAKQIETLTLVEERNRMARDLHDTLGHSFISYIVGLDAVLYLVDSNTAEARRKIEDLRNYASENLDQIRETIHEIGTEEEISLTSNFSAIIDEFSEYTNTKVFLRVTGEELVFPHSIRMALLRCLQESLTNAKRHGHATEVSVNLSFLEDEVDLHIKDNGLGTEKVELGFGLRSMKERLMAFNGDFQVVSSQNEGTLVSCRVPFRR